jgi:hypothetical protein
MEMFGGFMMVVSILFFFLAVIWFILPFIIFAIKGKVDRSVEQLEGIERRLTAIEGQLAQLDRPRPCTADVPPDRPSDQLHQTASAPDHAEPAS